MTSVNALSSGLTSGTAASALAGTSGTTADSSLANALTGQTTDPTAAAAAGGTISQSGTDSIADSTSKALQQISDQIAALGATASSNVQEFEKTTSDVLYDNNATARTIGFREGDPVRREPLLAFLRQLVADNRAGGWRRLKAARDA